MFICLTTVSEEEIRRLGKRFRKLDAFVYFHSYAFLSFGIADFVFNFWGSKFTRNSFLLSDRERFNKFDSIQSANKEGNYPMLLIHAENTYLFGAY
jgi:hypothetical protein